MSTDPAVILLLVAFVDCVLVLLQGVNVAFLLGHSRVTGLQLGQTSERILCCRSVSERNTTFDHPHPALQDKQLFSMLAKHLDSVGYNSACFPLVVL